MMSEGLSKSERIRSERRIGTLFNEGRRGGAGPIRYCWMATVTADGTQTAEREVEEIGATREENIGGNSAAVSAMFSVPKKVFKRAWKRNLIRRRIKESYRRRKGALAEAATVSGRHIDIAFICAPTPAIPDFKTIDNAVATILEQILERN